jgi:nuclear transport factor 2 (NTF2) superfamily protein
MPSRPPFPPYSAETAAQKARWEFDEQCLMRRRIASINDLRIVEDGRKVHWPLGRRTNEHRSLSELGL